MEYTKSIMIETLTIKAVKLRVDKAHGAILRELDFVIPAGAITGLIGPSGSGKTTLMRAIAGVQQITSGSLTVGDVNVGSKRLRPKIGYMAQTPAIYGDLTVRQNLGYFSKIVAADKQRVAECIAAVNLVDHQHKLVDQLSGGQRSRVSLAIAMLGNPDVLILDEPTVGLDPVLRRDLWQLFRRLADQGKTLIISSHVMDEAERCDNVLLLRDGRLLWNDTKQALLEVTKVSTVEAAFLDMVNNKGVK